MNVRALPRQEIEPTLRRMLELRPEPERASLTAVLDRDQVLLDRSPGETFGELSDRLDWSFNSLETRSVGLRFAGIGLIYVSALGGFGAWLVHPALGVAVGATGVAACGLCLAGSLRVGRQAGEKREEGARVRAWIHQLETSSDEVQRYLDARRETEALRNGLARSEAPSVRESRSRVDVGPIPVKKRGGLRGLLESFGPVPGPQPRMHVHRHGAPPPRTTPS